MSKSGLKINLINELSKIMPINEAQSELDFLLSVHFGISKTEQIIKPEIINNFEKELTEIVIKRVKTREPLQYIISKATFYGEIYYVDKNVLIPRPETELLVQEVIKHANSTAKILDIGTGSGCIPISLAKNLNNNNITSVDISDGAIEVAKRNAQQICPETNINFIKSDLFKNINEKFDIIVSNPPYIKDELKKDMQKEVLDYEPHNALFAEEDGLYFYKKIIKSAPNYLNENGFIAFEGGINQAQEIANLLEKADFTNIVIIPDLSFIDRIVTACYNSVRKGN